MTVLLAIRRLFQQLVQSSFSGLLDKVAAFLNPNSTAIRYCCQQLLLYIYFAKSSRVLNMSKGYMILSARVPTELRDIFVTLCGENGTTVNAAIKRFVQLTVDGRTERNVVKDFKRTGGRIYSVLQFQNGLLEQLMAKVEDLEKKLSSTGVK